MIKIKPSSRNTNKHTTDGMQLLENSIDTVGVIESISVATDGTIISGHARKELFDKRNMIPKHIKLETNEYAVLETNIENESKQYYQAQILANTTGNRNYDLDTDLVDVLIEEYDIDAEEMGLEILTFDDIEKKDFSDKHFISEFNKINDDNCEFPIVASFMESQECFIIPVSNEIDENFIRNIFGLNVNFQSRDKKIRKSNVISVETIRTNFHSSTD